MRTLLKSFTLLLLVQITAPPAAAYLANMNHRINLQEAALDSTPPGKPAIQLERVRRACEGTTNACDIGNGTLYFLVAPPLEGIPEDAGPWPHEFLGKQPTVGLSAITTQQLPPVAALHLFLEYPLELPCPTLDSQCREFWGAVSANQRWTVVGAKRNSRKRSGCSCSKDSRATFLIPPSGDPVRLPHTARGASVSNDGVVALFADDSIIFTDSAGQELGRGPERWACFRGGCERGDGGFIPDTDEIVRFGPEGRPGGVRWVARCSDSSGMIKWQYETDAKIFAVRRGGDGFFTIEHVDSTIRLTPDGVEARN